MALSNWLTRDEWNACFILGWKKLARKRNISSEEQVDLSTQMRAGIAVMAKAGYKFKGINADENGDFEKVTQCCKGNESCLAEFLTGNLDVLRRSEELLAWAPANIPSINLRWLRKLVEESNSQRSK